MLLLLLACDPRTTPDDTPTPPEPLVFVAEPALVVVEPSVGLARELSWSTNQPASGTVTWIDDDRIATRSFTDIDTGVVPILRLRPDRDVTVRLTMDTAEGAHLDHELVFRSDPLPDRFADILVRIDERDRRVPGDTLLGVVSPSVGYYQVVLDEDGEVVWFWERFPRVLEMQLRDDGTLLGLWESGGLFQLDWLGRELARWAPADSADGTQLPVPVGRLHHDVQTLPDGTLLALSQDVETPPLFPTSYDDPTALAADQRVRADAAVVIDPASGDVLARYPLSDAVPFTRIGYESLIGDPNDWSHCNGAAYNPENDAFVVSSRQQDTLVGFSRDGEVRWILANPANWPPEAEAKRLKPVGPAFVWPYKQHAPEWWGEDRVLMFDNGNYRASPFTGETKLAPVENWSRLVQFRIDEAAGTVALDWEYELPGTTVYSSYMGDVDHLEGDNVLGLFAGVVAVDHQLLPTLGMGAHLIRLVEFDASTGETLWDVELSSSKEEASAGWNSYRAQRLPVGWHER